MSYVNFMNMKSNETAEAVLIVLKTIGKWLLYAALIVLALGLALLAIIEIDYYFKNKPKIISEFKNITLGEKISDVRFKISGLVLLEKNDKAVKNDLTIYKNDDLRIGIFEKSGIVYSVAYVCNDGYDATSINGIRCEDKGEQILKKFKKDLRVLCQKNDASSRSYEIPKYGIRYVLNTNSVIAFYIFSPSDLKYKSDENFKPCV